MPFLSLLTGENANKQDVKRGEKKKNMAHLFGLIYLWYNIEHLM